MTPTEITLSLWRSGFVNRWHANPDHRLRNSGDTTAAHSQRVAVLMMQLFGSEVDAQDVRYALLHDAPECETGDMPRGCGAKEALRSAEENWFGRHDMALSGDWAIKLCDSLDAILFCHLVAPDLLARDDWRAHIAEVRGLAEKLRVLDDVHRLLALAFGEAA